MEYSLGKREKVQGHLQEGKPKTLGDLNEITEHYTRNWGEKARKRDDSPKIGTLVL